jgi:hypothetical protein
VPPVYFDPTKIGDRRMAADGGKRDSPEYVCDVTTGLLGGWRKARHYEIVVPSGSGGIAGDKSLRMTGQRQIRPSHNPSCAVRLDRLGRTSTPRHSSSCFARAFVGLRARTTSRYIVGQ